MDINKHTLHSKKTHGGALRVSHRSGPNRRRSTQKEVHTEGGPHRRTYTDLCGDVHLLACHRLGAARQARLQRRVQGVVLLVVVVAHGGVPRILQLDPGLTGHVHDCRSCGRSASRSRSITSRWCCTHSSGWAGGLGQGGSLSEESKSVKLAQR